jgi:hypothetical protein
MTTNMYSRKVDFMSSDWTLLVQSSDNYGLENRGPFLGRDKGFFV